MITVEMALTMATAVASAIGGAATLAWWLSKQFSETRKGLYEALERHRDNFSEKVDEHEQLDQDRHEENLARFGSIQVALAKLGYEGDRLNGHQHR